MSDTRMPLTPLQDVTLPTLSHDRKPTPSASASSGVIESVKARRSWKSRLLWGVVVLAALGAGWTYANRSLSQPDKEMLPPETEANTHDPDVVMVTVEPVAYRPVQRSVEAIGTLYGYEEVTIAAKLDGRVRKI